MAQVSILSRAIGMTNGLAGADFFYPSLKLLESVPLVTVRGNHENCKRAGCGRLNFLIMEQTEFLGVWILPLRFRLPLRRSNCKC